MENVSSLKIKIDKLKAKNKKIALQIDKLIREYKKMKKTVCCESEELGCCCTSLVPNDSDMD